MATLVRDEGLSGIAGAAEEDVVGAVAVVVAGTAELEVPPLPALSQGLGGDVEDMA